MADTQIIGILQQYLWTGVYVAAPLLITALVVGVIVGLFQALTSIQEMTLTFVPKLVAMLIAFTMCSSFAARAMLSLFDQSLAHIIGGI